MAYQLISVGATVEVLDLKGLIVAWKQYGPDSLVGHFVVRKPLTEAQLRRLPKALKALLSPDDSVGFLKRLYGLRHSRD